MSNTYYKEAYSFLQHNFDVIDDCVSNGNLSANNATWYKEILMRTYKHNTDMDRLQSSVSNVLQKLPVSAARNVPPNAEAYVRAADTKGRAYTQSLLRDALKYAQANDVDDADETEPPVVATDVDSTEVANVVAKEAVKDAAQEAPVVEEPKPVPPKVENGTQAQTQIAQQTSYQANATQELLDQITQIYADAQEQEYKAVREGRLTTTQYNSNMGLLNRAKSMSLSSKDIGYIQNTANSQLGSIPDSSSADVMATTTENTTAQEAIKEQQGNIAQNSQVQETVAQAPQPVTAPTMTDSGAADTVNETVNKEVNSQVGKYNQAVVASKGSSVYEPSDTVAPSQDVVGDPNAVDTVRQINTAQDNAGINEQELAKANSGVVEDDPTASLYRTYSSEDMADMSPVERRAAQVQNQRAAAAKANGIVATQNEDGYTTYSIKGEDKEESPAPDPAQTYTKYTDQDTAVNDQQAQYQNLQNALYAQKVTKNNGSTGTAVASADAATDTINRTYSEEEMASMSPTERRAAQVQNQRAEAAKVNGMQKTDNEDGSYMYTVNRDAAKIYTNNPSVPEVTVSEYSQSQIDSQYNIDVGTVQSAADSGSISDDDVETLKDDLYYAYNTGDYMGNRIAIMDRVKVSSTSSSDDKDEQATSDQYDKDVDELYSEADDGTISEEERDDRIQQLQDAKNEGTYSNSRANIMSTSGKPAADDSMTPEQWTKQLSAQYNADMAALQSAYDNGNLSAEDFESKKQELLAVYNDGTYFNARAGIMDDLDPGLVGDGSASDGGGDLSDTGIGDNLDGTKAVNPDDYITTHNGSGARLTSFVTSDGNDDDNRIGYIKLVESGSGMASIAAGENKQQLEAIYSMIKDKYNRFIITSIQEARNERSSVMPTVGDSFAATFSGRQPMAISVQGFLLFDYDTSKMAWYHAFMNAYEYYLRASQLAKWRAKMKLVMPDFTEYTGYMLSVGASMSSEGDVVIPMNFSMLVVQESFNKAYGISMNQSVMPAIPVAAGQVTSAAGAQIADSQSKDESSGASSSTPIVNNTATVGAAHTASLAAQKTAASKVKSGSDLTKNLSSMYTSATKVNNAIIGLRKATRGLW